MSLNSLLCPEYFYVFQGRRVCAHMHVCVRVCVRDWIILKQKNREWDYGERTRDDQTFLEDGEYIKGYWWLKKRQWGKSS